MLRSILDLLVIYTFYFGIMLRPRRFHGIRTSVLWPFLCQPYWCAVLALALNTAAYASELLRGGLHFVPHGQIEATRAYGMRPQLCGTWLLLGWPPAFRPI